MEIKILNPDNLTDNEVDEIVTRIKVFLLNENNKILIAHCGECCMLPGGHVENNESLISTLKRELLEETGISIDDSEIKQPFLEVRTYKKNHRETNKNRMSKIVYFFIKTNKKPDLNNLNLTEHEKENNFSTSFVDINSLEETLKKIINNSKLDYVAGIANEILFAFKKLENYLKNIKN